MNKTEYYIYLSEHNHHHEITKEDARQIFSDACKKGIQVINIESEAYPDCLRAIDSPPLVLYCLGDLSLLKKEKIAVVGTRRASPYGRWAASRIGKEIANLGLVHVSGMAWGIDSVSHEAVIENGGKSIAVLGTGVDVCYPKSSRNVYEELIKSGLVVSEYPPGTTGHPRNFPERNRIISGLAEKVIIVEGALRSGSLITAKFALEQGRDVYAVPGNINQPNSIGTNLLIYEGAIPLIDIDNFSNSMGIEEGLDEELSLFQKEIIDEIRRAGGIIIEELAFRLDLPVNFLLSELNILENKGFLRNMNGLICL